MNPNSEHSDQVKGSSDNLWMDHVGMRDERMFRRLVESANNGIFIADQQEMLFYANPAMARIFGYSTTDEIIGKSVPSIVFKHVQDRIDVVRMMAKSGHINNHRIVTQNKLGHPLTILLTMNHIRNDKGVVIGLEGIVMDITERDHLESALRHEKRKMEQILDFGESINGIHNFDELINVIAQQTSVILESRRCSVMLLDEQEMLTVKGAYGLDDEQVYAHKVAMGDPIVGLVARDMHPLLVKNIEYDDRFGRANRDTCRSRSFMCCPIVFEDRLLGVINVTDKADESNSEAIYSEVDLKILVAISREVASAIENLRMYKELNILATTDPLTHTFNFRHFSKSLDYELARQRRMKGSLSLIMLDIDDFKSYNDTFGHVEGDALLQGFGQILRDSIREMDIACRYAGDEFAVILPDTDLDGASHVAEKIRCAGESARFKRVVTFSLGVAGYSKGMSKKEFIKCADQALYRAKHQGKNQISIYSPTVHNPT
jgi:diguanylate cyclase (GGDEF)-like protein/PAS domain S-box-containing protein